MEFRDFLKNIWAGITFTFALSVIALSLYTRFSGDDSVLLREISAVFVMSVLIYLAGIVLCSNRSLKRSELFIRHIIRLFIIVGIVLSVATFERWLLWSEPITVIPFLGITILIYSIGLAVSFYESKILMDRMNEKLKERNRG
jgi:hypothetical protein